MNEALVAWAWSPASGVTGVSRSVLACLACQADAKGVALVTIEALVTATGFARSTVFDALRTLREARLVGRPDDGVSAPVVLKRPGVSPPTDSPAPGPDRPAPGPPTPETVQLPDPNRPAPGPSSPAPGPSRENTVSTGLIFKEQDLKILSVVSREDSGLFARDESETESGEREPKPKRPRTKPALPIPEDFALTPKMRAFALTHGIPASDVDRQFGIFKGTYEGKQVLSPDWPARWRTWVLRYPDFRPTNNGNGHAVPERVRGRDGNYYTQETYR